MKRPDSDAETSNGTAAGAEDRSSVDLSIDLGAAKLALPEENDRSRISAREASVSDPASELLDSTGQSSEEQSELKPKAAAQQDRSVALQSVADALLHSGGPANTENSSFSRLAGIFASVLAHLVLIGLLAFVTLKIPGPPAGMSFAAASESAVEEIVELEQPTDADQPSEAENSEQIQSEIDFAEQFSDLQATPVTTDSIGELLSASESLASNSARTATSESTFSKASAATFFGAAAGGNNFCYVIDGSGSMRGGPWLAARAELLKSLASLKENQRFYIIIFTRTLEVLPEPGSREPAASALYATKENLDHARRWLMSVKIGNSGGPPKKAIEMAIEKEPDAIYLLTDGVTSVKDVAESIREKNTISDFVMGDQTRVPIHAIAYYSLEGQELLRRIAGENKGQFIYVPNPAK